MAIELPPIYVDAVSSGYAPPPGGPFNAPNPGLVVISQMQQRQAFYSAGMWREMVMKLCNEQLTYMPGGKIGPTGVIGGFGMDCSTLQWADIYMSNNPSMNAAQALNYVTGKMTSGNKIVPEASMPSKFSGGVLTPVAALGHFMYGKGSTAQANINSIGLQLNSTEIPALNNALVSAPVGTSTVSIDKIPYNTANDSWATGLWLGNITLKIEGTITKSADGSVAFQGEARAYNDTYDANPGSWRSAFGESATHVLSEIQKHVNATTYEIEIQGSYPISIRK
ncbi:lipid II-degrading bacteriocin [Pantoea sp. Tr-811]|uniref:lipid II-degrading bacteriocin n=1 Tax=Pantoea sp. Tr-811 TaxID=2608361 RepID=UPI00141E4F4F|nr:lipid II-degrading bacteriocin [Pantoea sp. Tr-811]NIF28356.1 lipid II-degrading bacteriocin [Pantoea sp. Tr-811]